MPEPTTYADLADLRRDLAERLSGLAAGEVVRLAHELPPDEAPTETRRGLLGRRREVRVPSTEEYFAQVLALDDATVLAQLSGSTYAGGHHVVDAATHDAIRALGWTTSTDPDAADRTEGVYAARWDSRDPDGLAGAIVGALRLLGARPDVPCWSLSRSR